MANITTNKARWQMLKDFLEGKTVKVMIVNDTHVNSRDHNFVSDVVANEVEAAAVDGAYSRVTVTGLTFTEHDDTDTPIVSANSVTFENLNTSEDIGKFIVYREETNDADSIIINEVDTLIPAGSSTNILPKSTDGTDIQLTIAQLLGVSDA